jgi:peptidase E
VIFKQLSAGRQQQEKGKKDYQTKKVFHYGASYHFQAMSIIALTRKESWHARPAKYTIHNAWSIKQGQKMTKPDQEAPGACPDPALSLGSIPYYFIRTM